MLQKLWTTGPRVYGTSLYYFVATFHEKAVWKTMVKQRECDNPEKNMTVYKGKQI